MNYLVQLFTARQFNNEYDFKFVIAEKTTCFLSDEFHSNLIGNPDDLCVL